MTSSNREDALSVEEIEAAVFIEVVVPRIFAVFGLLLFSLTWKLWTPQEIFPQVSLISLSFSLPTVVEWSCFVTVFASLVGSLVFPTGRFGRISAGCCSASLALLFIDDTHRLQPWAWHLFLVNAFLATAPRKLTIPLIKWLTISIYFFSAISKFDINFVQGAGAYLLEGLLYAIGVPSDSLSAPTKSIIIWGFPASELALALGLCWRRTRFVAFIASLVMHAMLLVTLGPIGLNHEWPVLVWNLLFVAQNIVLFGLGQRALFAWHASGTMWAAACPFGLIIALPILSFFSIWPHWISWGLYSEQIDDVFLYISEDAKAQLPAEWKRHVISPEIEGNLCRVRTDRFSLDVLNAPEFPQQRFQVGVALSLAQKHDWQDDVLLVIKSTPDRRTGWRETRRFSGYQKLLQLGQENGL